MSTLFVMWTHYKLSSRQKRFLHSMWIVLSFLHFKCLNKTSITHLNCEHVHIRTIRYSCDKLSYNIHMIFGWSLALWSNEYYGFSSQMEKKKQTKLTKYRIVMVVNEIRFLTMFQRPFFARQPASSCCFSFYLIFHFLIPWFFVCFVFANGECCERILFFFCFLFALKCL